MSFLKTSIWNWVKQRDSGMQGPPRIEGCFLFGRLEADGWYAGYFLFRPSPLAAPKLQDRTLGNQETLCWENREVNTKDRRKAKKNLGYRVRNEARQSDKLRQLIFFGHLLCAKNESALYECDFIWSPQLS